MKLGRWICSPSRYCTTSVKTTIPKLHAIQKLRFRNCGDSETVAIQKLPRFRNYTRFRNYPDSLWCHCMILERLVKLHERMISRNSANATEQVGAAQFHDISSWDDLRSHHPWSSRIVLEFARLLGPRVQCMMHRLHRPLPLADLDKSITVIIYYIDLWSEI